MNAHNAWTPILSFTVSLIFLGALSAQAEVTSLVNYQGKLKKHGTNENGQVSITFKVFTGETNSECVFEETQLVQVTDGLYSTLIGKNPTSGSIENASMLDDAYIELTIGGKPMKPREKFCPPAFAKKAEERWNTFFDFNISNERNLTNTTTVYSFEMYTSLMFNVLEPEAGYNRTRVGFPLPSEPKIVSSAKVLINATGWDPNSGNTNSLFMQLKACSLTSEKRDIGPVMTVGSVTNLPLRTWISLPIYKNSTNYTLRTDEILYIDIYQHSLDFKFIRVFCDVRVK